MSDDDDEPGASTIEDGDSVEVQGSSSTYTLSRQGNVYMCSCPAWKNQSAPIDARTCKHLRAYLGDTFETSRVGAGANKRSAATIKKDKDAAEGKAPPVLLAHKWETHNDPTGWWMSEKLDGIRAYWDGEGFISRLGNKFYAPDWFIADLPADTLDGELWVGRKMFSEAMSIVRSGGQSDEWKKVTYVVFDAPEARGGFEERLAHIEKVMTRAAPPYARALEHIQCEGMDHLREELQKVEALGGEGLMLRQPKSNYAIGRSNTLLKVKTFHDAEATVVGHSPGTGKHKGKLGALVVQLADGTRFNVGTGFSDAEREDPAPIGSVITFRYQELTKDGVPRFPSWVGLRIDVETPAPIGKDGAKKSGGAKIVASKPAAAAKPKKPAPKPEPEPADDDPDEASDDDAAIDEQPADNGRGPLDYFTRLVHDGEKKFWEVSLHGSTYYTHFGKLGSTGQTRVTDLGSKTAARTDVEKRAAQKRKEGYRLDNKKR